MLSKFGSLLPHLLTIGSIVTHMMSKVIMMVNTACDLLDSVFMLVAATVLDLLPSAMRSSIL